MGDFCLEVIEVPGHTRGTIVLLDRVHRVVYSGDACNANTLLGFPGSASVEEYLEALCHFQSYETEFEEMWGGHGGRAAQGRKTADSEYAEPGAERVGG